MLVTDAQVHLWEPSRADRTWPPGTEVSAQHGVRLHGFSAEEMLAEMSAAGVHRAVIVPPSWVGENNATALEAAQKYPNSFAVMGRFDPRAPDAATQLAGWLKKPHMLGIRMTFNPTRFARWLDDGSLNPFFAAAERLGIPLMLSVPGMAVKVQPIAERHPGLTIIVDHMGLVTGAVGAAAFVGFDALLSLGRYPNVLIKVSSSPSYSTQPYPYGDLHDALRRVYGSFGSRRILWGSDITRLPGSYRECLTLYQEALDFLGAEDKEWITGKALAEALRWPEEGWAPDDSG